MRLHSTAATLAALVLVTGASMVFAASEEACQARIDVWLEQQHKSCESEESPEATSDCLPVRPGLATLCPELAATLVSHPLEPSLARSPGQRAPADAARIEALQAYYDNAQSERRPDLQRLPDVLSQMREPVPRRLSLREQFWRWLTHKLGLDEFELPQWTEDISISPRVFDTVFYSLIALLLILAAAVILNELRQRRVGRGGRRVARWSLQAGPAISPPTLAELEAAPLSEQPRLLLAMAIHALSSSGAIDYRDSMTHRQLANAARVLPDGEGLVLLSKAAERCAYGGWEPSAQEWSALRSTGQGLLRRAPT